MNEIMSHMRCIQTALNQYVSGRLSFTKQLSHWACCVRSESYVASEVLRMKLSPI